MIRLGQDVDSVLFDRCCWSGANARDALWLKQQFLQTNGNHFRFDTEDSKY